jgi:hypothetical protein
MQVLAWVQSSAFVAMLAYFVEALRLSKHPISPLLTRCDAVQSSEAKLRICNSLHKPPKII